MATSNIEKLKNDPRIRELARSIVPPTSVSNTRKLIGMPIHEFATKYFYLESGQLMTYIPHVFLILDVIFNPSKYGIGKVSEVLYSAPKKSIKTSVTGLVARWVPETWGGEQQIFAVANDQEQARGRLYQTFLTSLEQSPAWDRQKRMLRDLDGNPIWRVIERDSKHIPTGSVLKAISSDYKGEAGSNPTASFITEAWGITLERDKILYDELTVPPTRPRGFKWLDSYAGYVGVSKLLKERWDDCVVRGQRLTKKEVPQWPFDGDLPLFYNEVTQHFGYIDSGVQARRMPWQVGPDGEAYYAKEYASLRPEAYTRLHLNEWVGDTEAFIPVEWWDNCYDPEVLPLTDSDRTPIVVGVDASVSGDCTGLVAVSRHPKRHKEISVRLIRKFDPPAGGKLDYASTIEKTLREWCARYNVVHVAYDEYQLHYLMSNIRNERVAWTKNFSQGGDRSKADKQLYDLIRDRQITHSLSGGDLEQMRDHLTNAVAKHAVNEDTKLRIVKRDTESHIDLVIAMSMAAAQCLYLNL